METPEIGIGWTTTETEAEANDLAARLIASGLAACVQVDGPVRSHYRWQGQVETGQEWRLAVKFALARAGTLRAFLDENHPYDTPQWVVARAVDVLPAYAAWVADVRPA